MPDDSEHAVDDVKTSQDERKKAPPSSARRKYKVKTPPDHKGLVRTGPVKTGRFHAQHPGLAERRQEMRVKAYQMRAYEGRTYREIAEALSVSEGSAYALVQERIEMFEAPDDRMVTMERLQTVGQCNEMLKVWMPLALSRDLDVSMETDGDGGTPKHIEMPSYKAGTKAAEIVIKIMDRKAKLLGLDAPQRVEGVHVHIKDNRTPEQVAADGQRARESIVQTLRLSGASIHPTEKVAEAREEAA